MYHFHLIEQGLKTSEYSKCIQGQKTWFIQKLLLSLWDPKRFIVCSFLSSFWVRWEPAVYLLLVKHCLETFPFVIGLFSGRGCSDITTIPGLSLLNNFQVNSSIKNIRLLVIECFPSSGASVCGWHMLDLYNTILSVLYTRQVLIYTYVWNETITTTVSVSKVFLCPWDNLQKKELVQRLLFPTETVKQMPLTIFSY